MEEIFKVKASGDIKDMDLCGITEDTWPTPRSPKNQRLQPAY